MVEKEFVIEEWDSFYEFVKERPVAYKFLEIIDQWKFYAYMLGTERIGFLYGSTSEKDFQAKIELLKKQGFVIGYSRAVK